MRKMADFALPASDWQQVVIEFVTILIHTSIHIKYTNTTVCAVNFKQTTAFCSCSQHKIIYRMWSTQNIILLCALCETMHAWCATHRNTLQQHTMWNIHSSSYKLCKQGTKHKKRRMWHQHKKRRMWHLTQEKKNMGWNARTQDQTRQKE